MSLTSSLLFRLLVLIVTLGIVGACGNGCCCGNDCTPSGEGEGEGEGPGAPSIVFSGLPAGAVQCSDDTDPNTAGEQVVVNVVLEGGADCTTVTVSNSRNSTNATANVDANGKAAVTVTLVGADAPGAQNPLTATCTTSDGKTLTVTDSIADECTTPPPDCTPVVTIDSPLDGDTITVNAVPATTTITLHASISNAAQCNPTTDQNTLVETGIVICTATANGTTGQQDQITLATGTATDGNLQLPDSGATTISCTLQDNATTPAFKSTATATVGVTVNTVPPPGCVINFPVDGTTYTETDDADHNINNGINLPLNADCPANNPASYALTCTNETFTGTLTATPNGANTFHLSTTLDGTSGPDCKLDVTMQGVGTTTINYHINAAVPHLNVAITPPQSATGFYDTPDDSVVSTPTDTDIDVPVTLTPVAFPAGTFSADLTVTNTRTGQVVDRQSAGNTPPNAIDLGDGTQPVQAIIHLPIPSDDDTFVVAIVANQSGAGQIGPTAGANMKADTVAPTVTNFFPNSGVNVNLGDDTDGDPSNGLQANLIFSVSPDTATCVVSLDGTVLPASSVTVSGTTCVASNVTLAPDGPHQLSATVTDLAGHSTTAPTITFQSDGTVPTVTSLVADQAGVDNVLNVADNANQQTSGNVTTTMTIVVSSDLDGATITATTPAGTCTGTVDNTGTAHLANCPLQQGANTVTVTGTDAGGNSITGASFTITVDTVAPVISIAAPTSGTTLLVAQDGNTGTAKEQTTVTVASDAEGSVVTIAETGTGQPTNVGTCTVSGGGCTANVSLDDGSDSLTATVADAAGNSSTSAAVAVTVDSTAPSCTITASNVQPTDDLDPVANGVQVNVSVTCNGLGAGRSLFIEDNLEGTINDGPCTSAADGTAKQCLVTYTQSATHNVSVGATEASGNPATSNTAAVTVVTGNFNVVINNPPIINGFRAIGIAQDSDSNPANGAQVIVTGTTDAPNTATATIVLKGVDQTGTPCTINNGSISCAPLTFTNGDSGSFEVRVVNLATTESGTSGVRTYEVDLGRPTITITNPATATVTFNKASDLVPGGALDVDVTVNITECQNGVAHVLDGTTVIGSANIDATGNATGLAIRATTSHEADAESWTVTCTDADGNAPATVPGFTAKVDITAPSSPTITSTVQNVRSGVVRFSYTQPGDDNNTGSAATVAMFCSKTNNITDANFGTGAGQVAIPLPTAAGGTAETPTSPPQTLAFDNTWFCALRATDDAGNTSTLATTSFTLATTAVTLAPPAGVTGWAQSLSRTVGDINGDGIDDFVVGAPDRGKPGVSAGGFEVILGGSSQAALSRTFVPAPTTITCAAPPCTPKNVGLYVDIVKSLNGDQFDDVIVVAVDQDNQQTFVLIYAGGPNGIAATDQPVSVLEQPTNSLGLLGQAGEGAQTVGDIDGDGDQDWAIPDFFANDVYVFLNKGVFPASGLMNARADTVITNSATDLTNVGEFGQALTGVGKLADGDQLADFVVSDSIVDPVRMFVIHGRATWPATLDVATLTGGDVVALGEPAASSAGFDLSAGDVDGDGKIDVGYLLAGGVVVVKGTGTTFSGETGFSISEAVNFGSGLVVQSLNGDARADIVGGGQSPTSVYFGGALGTGRNTPDVTYGVAAAGTNTFEYCAVNAISSSPEPDLVIADSDPPGSVTIHF